jgi:hypothetical protein
MCLLKLTLLRMVASLLLVIIYTFGGSIELPLFHIRSLTGTVTGAWQLLAIPRTLSAFMQRTHPTSLSLVVYSLGTPYS